MCTALITPAERARWLAELSNALHEAQMLLSQFALGDCQQQALELNLRISAAQAEIRSLQTHSASRLRPSYWEWAETALWIEADADNNA